MAQLLPLFRAVALIAASSVFAAAAVASDPSTAPRAQAAPHSETAHAKGTFEVKMIPESKTRFGMVKTFNGGLSGTSNGVLIGDDVVTAYAALEKFEGTLDGREGSFVLLHRGYMSEVEGMNLDIVIAPNSGTGELAGIRGKLAIKIDGSKHFYNLAYSLPVK